MNKILIIAHLILGVIPQTAQASFLTNLWSSKKKPTALTPKNPTTIREKKETLEISLLENSGPETTKTQWSSAQEEILIATKKMLESVLSTTQKLTEKLSIAKAEELATLQELKNLDGFVTFNQKHSEARELFHTLFHESLGLQKITELRQIIPNQNFSSLLEEVTAIEKNMILAIDALYQDKGSIDKNNIILVNVLQDALALWQAFMEKVKIICKNNSVYFTQGADEVTYLSSKGNSLKKIAQEAVDRITLLASMPANTAAPLPGYEKELTNAINALVESFINQWGFFHSMQDLITTINTTYNTAKNSIQMTVHTQEQDDLAHEDFEILDKTV